MAAALALLAAAAGASDYDAELAALTQGRPPDVRAFIARYAECYHWEGEEPYDKARGAEIGRAMRKLRCDALVRDEAALRRRHASDGGVRASLDGLRRMFPE